jgi:predicted  nucleic acid-binding Zn-ribbon protein
MSIAKKAGFGVLGALVLGGLIFGKNMFSYTSTAVNEAREAAEDSLSPGFQLKTAKNMLTSELEPEISRMRTVVSSARIDVRELTAALDKRANQVADSRDVIMERTKKLDSPSTTFTIGNVSYTDEELRADVAKRFDEFKLIEQTLDSEKQVLTAKQNALTKNEEKLVELRKASDELKLHIEMLEARLSAVEASETIADSDYDESKLKRVKDLIGRVEHKVAVREEAAVIEGETTDLIPVESESSKDIKDAVNAYFGNSKDGGDVAESTKPVEDAPANN